MKQPDSAWMIWSDEAVWSEAQSIRARSARDMQHCIGWDEAESERIRHVSVYRRINQRFLNCVPMHTWT